jgi:uncharacterized protein YuzE
MKKEGPPLKVLYDPEADILYLHFMDGVAEEVLDAGDNIVLELDKNKRVMGIEVWGASKRGVLEELKKILTACESNEPGK